ncbi:MAG: hypothetical protein HYV63_08220 [Candidatus Schekmanbacteria bacterium]|nr:hypothetical protein [Candidatus Schekmanbacteria bacterium]
MVLAPDDAVARWASRPIRTGHPGFDLVPMVLARAAVPWLVDPKQARQNPELAMISAIAHGGEDNGLAVALPALQAAAELEPDRALAYTDLIWQHLGEAARKVLENMLDLKEYQPQSELYHKYIRRWLEEGKAEGVTEGVAEGRAAGKAEDVLAVFEVRGLAVTDQQRELIVSCRDPGRLDCWLRRAISARSVEDALEGPKS